MRVLWGPAPEGCSREPARRRRRPGEDAGLPGVERGG